MAWTILQALAARDELAGEHEVRVAVSTEDQELAAIAATTEPRFRSCVPRILPKTLQPPNR